MLEARYVWLVDVGRTSLSRGFATDLATACLQQRLTPYSLGSRLPHAVESNGHGVRDSTVLSITECLTPKGSLSVPQKQNRYTEFKSLSPIPPLIESRGLLGGFR